VDVLKLDRFLISSLGRRFEFVALVQAMISLGHNLGLQLVAEGVETPEQVAQLQALECDWGQGPLFGPPATGAVAGTDETTAKRRSA
jgi:EAL domain-containing protein (putative c-di-GMP-specific phosphodiesterase class I)